MKTIYIAGPITGKPNFNWDAFYNAESELQDDNWLTVNPCTSALSRKLQQQETISKSDIKDVMLLDISLLANCDAVYMLNGWKESKGACAEYTFAKAIGLQILMQGD